MMLTALRPEDPLLRVHNAVHIILQPARETAHLIAGKRRITEVVQLPHVLPPGPHKRKGRTRHLLTGKVLQEPTIREVDRQLPYPKILISVLPPPEQQRILVPHRRSDLLHHTLDHHPHREAQDHTVIQVIIQVVPITVAAQDREAAAVVPIPEVHREAEAQGIRLRAVQDHEAAPELHPLQGVQAALHDHPPVQEDKYINRLKF